MEKKLIDTDFYLNTLELIELFLKQKMDKLQDLDNRLQDLRNQYTILMENKEKK